MYRRQQQAVNMCTKNTVHVKSTKLRAIIIKYKGNFTKILHI